MVHCDLCNTNTRCSCKGWGCPKCNNSNKLVWLTNELIKFWLEKETIKKEMAFIKEKAFKVDSYTLYEYLSWQINEEKLNEEIVTYVPKPESPKGIYYSVPTWETNPTKQCLYKKPWVWERCIYCNWIKKFQWNKDCPSYKEK